MFWDVLHNNGQSPIVEELLNALKANSDREPDALTSQEHAITHIVIALSALHLIYRSKEPYEKEAGGVFIQNLLEFIEEWIGKSAERLTSCQAPLLLTTDLTVPLWSVFHGLFTHLETCKFVLLTLEHAVNENKKQSLVGQVWLVDRAEALRNKCTKLADGVSRLANRMRDRLLEQSTLDQIEEVILRGSDETGGQDVLANELGDIGDYKNLQRICHAIVDSWVDGLDGVIQTKIE